MKRPAGNLIVSLAVMACSIAVIAISSYMIRRDSNAATSSHYDVNARSAITNRAVMASWFGDGSMNESVFKEKWLPGLSDSTNDSAVVDGSAFSLGLEYVPWPKREFLSDNEFNRRTKNAYRDGVAGRIVVMGSLPTGSWDVHGGVIDTNTLTVYPTQSLQSATVEVTVRYNCTDGADETVNAHLMHPVEVASDAAGDKFVVTNSWRWRSTMKLFDMLSSADVTKTHEYKCKVYKGTNFMWECADAFQRFNDGDSSWDGLPTSPNPSFFWPVLWTNLLCSTCAKHDTTTAKPQQTFVSPHYAVVAAHPGDYSARRVTSIEPFEAGLNDFDKTVVTYGDLRVVRYKDAMPSNMIARLIDSQCIKELAPEFPVGFISLQQSIHQTVTPSVVTRISVDASSADGKRAAAVNGEGLMIAYVNQVPVRYGELWSIAGMGLPDETVAAIAGLSHSAHEGDSGFLVAATGPSGQLIPIGMIWAMSGAGTTSMQIHLPAMFGPNVELIDKAIRDDSNGEESVWRWTPQELSE